MNKPIKDVPQAANRESILTLIRSNDLKERLRTLLPAHLCKTEEDLSRYRMMIETEIKRQPKILECTPGSFFNSLLQIVQLGLSPLLHNQHAYLIPYRNNKTNQTDCQMQVGWRGLVFLAKKNKELTNIWSTLVYRDDEIIVTHGTAPSIHHTSTFSSRGDKDITGVYACASYKDGTTAFELLSREECESIRNRSQAVKGGRDTPWNTDFGEMCRKTAIKRLCKHLPYNDALDSAIYFDNQSEREINVLDEEKPRSSVDVLKQRLASQKHDVKEEIPYHEEIVVEETGEVKTDANV